MALERKRVGEDWTDSVKNLKTSGTLDSGDKTITGDADVSGTITGAVSMQGAEQVLDESDLDSDTIISKDEIVNVGPSVPTSPFAGMLWFDTGNHLLGVRNEANNAWLSIWDIANNKPVITNLVDEITGLMIAPAVAGDGLVQDGSGNLDVNVDDSSIELSGDALRVKALGITVGKLATGNAQVSVSANDSTPGILNGKLIGGTGITLVEGSDGADETLTINKDGFRGALVFLNATSQTLSDPTADENIVWTNEVEDTDAFIDVGGANPDRITIVSADISRVRVTAKMIFSPSAGTADGTITVKIMKNGVITYSGAGYVRFNEYLFTSTKGELPVFVQTAPITVSQNDYFTVAVSWIDTPGVATLTVLGDIDGLISWFSIEVIE